MEFKVYPKEFPSATGMVKTVNSITIRAINVDRQKDKLDVNFYLSFNGFTKDLQGKDQEDIGTSINLSSDFLVRSVKEQLYQGISPKQEDFENEEDYQEALVEFDSHESTAREQIYPLLAGLLVGTWQQAYTAASALALQYNYTLLPIEEQ